MTGSAQAARIQIIRYTFRALTARPMTGRGLVKAAVVDEAVGEFALKDRKGPVVLGVEATVVDRCRLVGKDT